MISMEVCVLLHVVETIMAWEFNKNDHSLTVKPANKEAIL